MIDTGASRTVIRRDFYVKAGGKPLGPLKGPTKVITASGDEILTLGEAEIKLDEFGPLRVVVVNDLRYALIIGMDALRLGNAQLTCGESENIMIWRGKNVPLRSDIDVEQRSSRLSHAAYSVDLAEISAQLPAPEDPRLQAVLRENEEVFHGIETANPNPELVEPARIITTGPPIYQKPYRQELSKRKVVEEKWTKCSSRGNRPSSSPGPAPSLLCPRKTGVSAFAWIIEN